MCHTGFYIKNEKQMENYSFVTDFQCRLVTIHALYTKFILCMHETSLGHITAYVIEQNCAFRNEARSFVIRDKYY